MTRTQKIPPKGRAVATKLSRLPGVLGVFWGTGRKGAEWTREGVLCVHVQRKWQPPRAQRIESVYDGIRTDIVAVGEIRHHSIVDTADRVSAFSRASSISAFAEDHDGNVLALLSGHGTLKTNGSSFIPGPWPDATAPWADLVDDHTTHYTAQLRDGAVTPDMDFSLAAPFDLESDQVLLGHQMAALPITVRRSRLAIGDTVIHSSSMRGRTISGQVVHSTALGALHDGAGVEINHPIVVKANHGESAFSVEGDSGSLVFDEDRQAVGFVVAGASNFVVGYLMPFTPQLQTRMAGAFPMFFEVA